MKSTCDQFVPDLPSQQMAYLTLGQTSNTNWETTTFHSGLYVSYLGAVEKISQYRRKDGSLSGMKETSPLCAE